MSTVWHVDKYNITFKLVISRSNEISFSTHSSILISSEYVHYEIFIQEKCDNFQENLSRPGIIDVRARYRVPARAVEKHWLPPPFSYINVTEYMKKSYTHTHLTNTHYPRARVCVRARN
jgi:hypothetical protein